MDLTIIFAKPDIYQGYNIKKKIMAIDLLTTVQKNLGYPELKKIDPNTQETIVDTNKPNEHRLSQAIVPAVLAGIYKLAKTEDGIHQIAAGDNINNWIDLIFQNNKEEVLQNIRSYTFYDNQSLTSIMNKAAAESIKQIRENSKTGENYTEMKTFIAQQRNNILPFLPPALNIGNMLDDNTIDDVTTKMEGPVSNLMHKIETIFGGHETQEDADRKQNLRDA